jgi:hypothetical protein
MMEGDMTITQILGLAIGILALLLSSELVRSMAARQRRPEVSKWAFAGSGHSAA